jgi:hypothetical protein
MKILFVPVSIAAGFIGGYIGKKIFDEVWGLFDDQDPPEPEHHQTTWPKLMAAMALRGALFTVTRSAVERAAREGFYNVTGSWPGEEAPDVD